MTIGGKGLRHHNRPYVKAEAKGEGHSGQNKEPANDGQDPFTQSHSKVSVAAVFGCFQVERNEQQIDKEA